MSRVPLIVLLLITFFSPIALRAQCSKSKLIRIFIDGGHSFTKPHLRLGAQSLNYIRDNYYEFTIPGAAVSAFTPPAPIFQEETNYHFTYLSSTPEKDNQGVCYIYVTLKAERKKDLEFDTDPPDRNIPYTSLYSTGTGKGLIKNIYPVPDTITLIFTLFSNPKIAPPVPILISAKKMCMPSGQGKVSRKELVSAAVVAKQNEQLKSRGNKYDKADVSESFIATHLKIEKITLLLKDPDR